MTLAEWLMYVINVAGATAILIGIAYGIRYLIKRLKSGTWYWVWGKPAKARVHFPPFMVDFREVPDLPDIAEDWDHEEVDNVIWEDERDYH